MERETNMIKQINEVQEQMAALRRRRRRCIDFAYGRQWGDTIRTNNGRVMSEGAWMRRQGRTPITNNLIRRAIKGIIGYWEQQSGLSDNSPYKNTDVRTLEEMLISGVAAQRIAPDTDPLLPGVRQISPDDLFYDQSTDPTLIGATYHFSPSTIMQAFAAGDAETALHLAEVIEAHNNSEVTLIEAWQRVESPTLYWHDPLHALSCHTPCTRAHLDELSRLSQRRQEMNKPTLQTRFSITTQWQQTWLTERGQILYRRTYDNPNAMPYLIAVCTGLDGQIHSAVENLTEQQKYINRLISTLDSVINYSAKGVLLYPSDQLPRGMSWKEIRNLWDSPGSILPFEPTRKGLAPTQINANGRLDGAMQMLMLQMKMFDDMAGVDSATSGSRTTATGSEMLKAGIEQNHMVLRDILTTFNDLLTRRNARLA